MAQSISDPRAGFDSRSRHLMGHSSLLALLNLNNSIGTPARPLDTVLNSVDRLTAILPFSAVSDVWQQ